MIDESMARQMIKDLKSMKPYREMTEREKRNAADKLMITMAMVRPDLAKDFLDRPRFAPILRFFAWALWIATKARAKHIARRLEELCR